MAKIKYSNEQFTQKIRELIDNELSNGITYKMLEDFTKVPQASLNEYYNGDRVASTDNLVKLAKYFDCSIDSLLGISRISTIDNVCDYLGASYKTTVGIRDNFDVLYGNVKEHKELNNIDESILITILEHLFSHDDTFLDRLTRIIKTMVESNDAKWLRNTLKEKGMVKYLCDDSYDEDFAEFRTYKMLKDEFHEIADICGSTISKEDREIINSSSDIFSIIKNVSFQTLMSFDEYIENALHRALLEENNKTLVNKLCEYLKISGAFEVKCYQLQKLPPHLIQDALNYFDKE